ncbi:MAG: hypothetical protein ABI721_05265 [Candidatus Dojkabacteria bacterium]
MSANTFVTTWPDYIDFTRKYQNTQIQGFWKQIIDDMPDSIKSILPDIEPELQVFGKLGKLKPSTISYVFKVPNICNCNGINEFLENFVINVQW